MQQVVESRLARLTEARADAYLAGGQVGLEKESLRVSPDGRIAQTPHPRALGAALTNAYITTDYSEALIELITPPLTDAGLTLDFLDQIHRFVYAHLGEELLWATSMPCRIGREEDIPIARYGTSNVGTMKHVYRRGLGYRYGRVMQTISGVHFNYSPPAHFWPAYRDLLGVGAPENAFVADRYFGLIRNFQRWGWLISYLFGSSPAVCKSFLGDFTAGFSHFDRGTWFQPHATSLRMSDIGYKNKNQAGLTVSYDDLDGYVTSLTRAIETPDPAYQAIGVEVQGEYRQLNANILQIENEFYSFIRPKQVARSGEKPTVALRQRGVRYVEVRALDVSPFHPVGVDETYLRFLEAFLQVCLLADSPPIGATEQEEINHNQRLVACCGRDPMLRLRRDGREVSLRVWASEILEGMRGVCETLDVGGAGGAYVRALDSQRELPSDPSHTPSARVLDEMRERGESFFEFAMRRSQEHRDHLREPPLDREQWRHFTRESRRSLEEQARIEAADRLTFAEYLRRYFAQELDAPERVSA